MPEEDPRAIGQPAQHHPPTGSLQTRVVLLGWERLIDGIRNQPNVNDTPDGKDVTGRDEEDMERIRDLAGVQPIDGQGISQNVNGDGCQDDNYDGNLTKGVFH